MVINCLALKEENCRALRAKVRQFECHLVEGAMLKTIIYFSVILLKQRAIRIIIDYFSNSKHLIQ